MIHLRLKTALLVLLCVGLTASCSSFRDTKVRESAFEVETGPEAGSAVDDGSSLLDIFRGGGAQVKVNRYLWTAALQTLPARLSIPSRLC